MYAGRKIFGLARRLAHKEGQPVPIGERDAFSYMERYIRYGDYPYAILWSKGIVADQTHGKMREVERVQISSGFVDEDTGEVYDDELEVVFQGMYIPEQSVVETFYYTPDVWSEHLENRAKIKGITG